MNQRALAPHATPRTRLLLASLPFLAVLLVLLLGCDVQQTVGGRPYQLHWNPSVHTPAPLIVMLGGLGESTDDLAARSGADAFADSHGLTVAYAEHPSGSWDLGTTAVNADRWSPGRPDDLTYLRGIVDDVSRRLPIDRHRVYAVGFSDGGFMAIRAVCQLPDVFAAAGSISGDYLGQPCARPTWAHLHGGSDPIVPAAGGIPAFPSWNWPGCTVACFPPVLSEAASLGVAVIPAGSHSWPRVGDGSWNLDGMTWLWARLAGARL